MRQIITFLNKKSFSILLIAIIFFSICYATLSITRHMHFESGAFDLGIFDQAIWQYSHFLIPFNTIKMKIILGDHFDPILVLLAPLYWIWSDVRMLLIFQAVWVCVSAIPIYLYAQKKSFSNLSSLFFAVIFLSYYGIQYGIYFDFHPIMLAVGIMSWMLYFWETKKWKIFWVASALLLLTQENMSLALAGFALCFLFQKKRLKYVVLLLFISFVYLFVARFAISLFSSGNVEYIPHFPSNIAGYVTQLFDNQEKRQVWFYSYSWFSFLPLLSIGASLAVLLNIFQYDVLGQSAYWSPFTHHHALLVIFLFIGSIQTILFLKKKNITIPIVLLFVCPILLQFSNHFVLNNLSKKEFYANQQWMTDNYQLLKTIKKNDSVATQQSLVPHLSQRKYIYLVYPVKKDFKNAQEICHASSCWWLDFAGKPNLLIADAHPDEWLTMILAQSNDFRAALENMQRVQAIVLKEKIGEARMYSINYNKLKEVH